MKKTLLIISLFFSFFIGVAAPGPLQPVPETVLKNFAMAFPRAEGIQWSQEDGYDEVYFKLDDITFRLRYNQAGELFWTRRYYIGSQLNPYLKDKLIRKFPTKTVYGVTETTDADGVTYHVVLEDEKNLMNVLIDRQGYISVEKSYHKSEPGKLPQTQKK